MAMNGHMGIVVPQPGSLPFFVPSRRDSGGMQSDSDDERSGRAEGSDKKKRKRNRIQLSCVQCKRRKVKCSRTSPCEACVRHGCAEECKWEEGSGAEQIQPFAMALDLRALESRYRILEKYVVDKLAVNSGELASLLAEADSPPPLPHPIDRPFSIPHSMGPPIGDAGKDEDAALVLEELAMGTLTPAATRSPATHLKPRENVTTIMLSQTIDASERMSFLPPHELLSRLFTSLPSDAVILALVEACSNWFAFKGVFHRPTVLAETHEFIDARKRDDLGYIDPAWLALLLALMVVGLDDLGDFETHVAGVSFAMLKSMVPFWMSASRAALNLSNYFVTPQFRALQTLSLYTYLGSLPLGRNQNKGVSVWLASAVRMAEALGYHKLGTDENIMPDDDPGLPAGSSPLKRQMVLRLWTLLVGFDTIQSHPKWGFTYCIREGEFTTGEPANVDDDALTSQTRLVEKPLTEMTEASTSVLKIRMMLAFRQALQVGNIMAGQPPEQAAQTAIDLERKYRKIVDAHEGDGPKELRATVQSGLMARMLRMHRPFAQRYYDGDMRFAESMRASLECAFSVCSANNHQMPSEFTFLLRHLFLAVVTIFQHRFAMIRRGVPERDAIETSNAIDTAAVCFAKYRLNKAAELRLLAENGLNLVLSLREAEVGYKVDPYAETFNEIVKRLSATRLTVSKETLNALADKSAQTNWPASDNPSVNGSTVLAGIEAIPVDPPSGKVSSGGDTLETPDQLLLDPSLAGPAFADETNLFSFDWSTLLSGEGMQFDGGALF